MRFFNYQRQQTIGSLRLTNEYLPEALSISTLNMKDPNGNDYALYKDDYSKLKNYLMNQGRAIGDFALFPKAEKIGILQAAQVKLIKYFSESNLERLRLDMERTSFAPDGNIANLAGDVLRKEGYLNCVVIQDDRIYIHPKIRPTNGDCVNVGVHHSSLSLGRRVQFAGSFIYNEVPGLGMRWIFDNVSGHYSVYLYQLRLALSKMVMLGLDIEPLVVKVWLAKDDLGRPPMSDEDCDLFYVSASDLLETASSSIENIERQTDRDVVTVTHSHL